MRPLIRSALARAAVGLAGIIATSAQPAPAGAPGPGASLANFDGLASLDPPFIAYTGADYGPLQEPPPQVLIADVGGGFVAENVLDCATACTLNAACNSASYYGDDPVSTWPGGYTCWLKTISLPCRLPADHEVTVLPKTVFLLAQENCGSVIPAEAVAPGIGPDSKPGSAPNATAPSRPGLDFRVPAPSPAPAPAGAVGNATTPGAARAPAPAPSPAGAAAAEPPEALPMDPELTGPPLPAVDQSESPDGGSDSSGQRNLPIIVGAALSVVGMIAAVAAALCIIRARRKSQGRRKGTEGYLDVSQPGASSGAGDTVKSEAPGFAAVDFSRDFRSAHPSARSDPYSHLLSAPLTPHLHGVTDTYGRPTSALGTSGRPTAALSLTGHPTAALGASSRHDTMSGLALQDDSRATGYMASTAGWTAATAAGAAAPGSLAATSLRSRSLNTTATTATATAITQWGWTDFERAGGGAESAVEELEVALDAVAGMQQAFHGRYHLMSSVERRSGGQGVVQFASIANTFDKVAIKFYLCRSGFERERELYTDAQLRAMMPATLAIEDNAGGACRTPYGYVFPPFVIIEHGQSLDEWARRNADADFITIFQALMHAIRALARLHSCGLAHRDIKPGNILRRPNQHDWTLIDFGCAARTGSEASLSYSLKYAAPETVVALEAGRRTVSVSAAVDIWAIGVIAFELLTGERAFPAYEGVTEEAEYVQDALTGRAPLPWENPGAAAQALVAKLRGLKRTVLRCLQRDPAKRPTAEALLTAWEHSFDNIRGSTLTAMQTSSGD